jgi:hypothetical protein
MRVQNQQFPRARSAYPDQKQVGKGKKPVGYSVICRRLQAARIYWQGLRFDIPILQRAHTS